MTNRVSFTKATKTQSRLRMAIAGPSKSGKTYTSLVFGVALANGGTLALIDTERGSASKYADLFEFDVLELDRFSPDDYIKGIRAAEGAGYTVLIIDSLSHAWEGKGGILEMHDDATKRSRSKNSWAAWREVTPQHRSLVDAILSSRCHVIVTMRSKMAYIQTEDSRGKTTIEKVGMAPIQRQGMEYEFDIMASMDHEHNMHVGGSRCIAIDNTMVSKPTAEWFQVVRDWLTDGAPAPRQRPAEPPPTVGPNGERVPGKTDQEKRDDAPPADSTRRPTKPANGDSDMDVGWNTWSVNMQRSFWAKSNELNLSSDGVHQEFGVESMKDYEGSQDTARAILAILNYGINKCAIGLQGIWQALDVKAVCEWKGNPEQARTIIDDWALAQDVQGTPVQQQGTLAEHARAEEAAVMGADV